MSVLQKIIFWLQLALVFSFHSKFPANQNWECENCGDESHKELIYGMVRHAMYAELREVYLNLDHYWIDDALEPGRKVIVKNVNRNELADLKMPEHERYGVESMLSESIYVIISFAKDDNQVDALSGNVAAEIDQFLTFNPCWIPLHEPPIQLPKSTEDVSFPADFDEMPNEREYEHSLILVALPNFPYHSTCALFRRITQQQFPDECPDESSDNAVVSHLRNEGWAYGLIPLMEHFIDALHTQKVFITPRARLNDEQAKATESEQLKLTIEQQEYNFTGPWTVWADHEECDPSTLLWNPWNCHFISLSHCNKKELRDFSETSELYSVNGADCDYIDILVRLIMCLE